MRRTLAGMVALVLVLSGCGGQEMTSNGDSSPPGYSDTGGYGNAAESYTVPADTSGTLPSEPGGGQATPWTVMTETAVCNANAPGAVPLAISTTDLVEMTYLRQWDACQGTDEYGTYTWLRNRSDAVWLLPNTRWDSVHAHRGSDKEANPPEFLAFHGMARARGLDDPQDPAFITPGASMRVAADPSQVSWEIDQTLTWTWGGNKVMMDKAKSYGQKAALNALVPKGGATAAAECLLAVHGYVESIEDKSSVDLKSALARMNARSSCVKAAEATPVDETHPQAGTFRSRVLNTVDEAAPKIAETENTISHLLGAIKATGLMKICEFTSRC